MNIDRLETHDRLLQFQKQADLITQGCIDCIANVPDAVKCPFYVFAHPRTVDTQEQKSLIIQGLTPIHKPVTQRLIWSPRVTKPKAQTNSYLFLARKNSDVVKIIWMLPPRELWDQYAPGQMTHNLDIWVSIQNFQYCREQLERLDPDGPTERDQEHFRKVIGEEAQKKLRQKKLKEMVEKTKPMIEELSSSPFPSLDLHRSP